jgi:hypothetical protein
MQAEIKGGYADVSDRPNECRKIMRDFKQALLRLLRTAI